MTAEKTLESLAQFCKNSSGDEYTWHGKSATYQWNIGRENAAGIVNGVVRKLAGVDSSGKQIWVVAGSLKINPDGTVARFTGIPSKIQKTFESPVSKTAIDCPAVEIA
jgi:hypothetical protein